MKKNIYIALSILLALPTRHPTLRLRGGHISGASHAREFFCDSIFRWHTRALPAGDGLATTPHRVAGMARSFTTARRQGRA